MVEFWNPKHPYMDIWIPLTYTIWSAVASVSYVSTPDPETGALPSAVANPFRRSYRVRQLALPSSDRVPRGSLFVPVRVTSAGLPFDYKRIDVTVESVSPRPELGQVAARVSALRANPARDGFLSREDPDP